MLAGEGSAQRPLVPYPKTGRPRLDLGLWLHKHFWDLIIKPGEKQEDFLCANTGKKLGKNITVPQADIF